MLLYVVISLFSVLRYCDRSKNRNFWPWLRLFNCSASRYGFAIFAFYRYNLYYVCTRRNYFNKSRFLVAVFADCYWYN